MPWTPNFGDRLDEMGSPTGMYGSPRALWVNVHHQQLMETTGTVEGTAQRPVCSFQRVESGWEVVLAWKPLSREET